MDFRFDPARLQLDRQTRRACLKKMAKVFIRKKMARDLWLAIYCDIHASLHGNLQQSVVLTQTGQAQILRLQYLHDVIAQGRPVNRVSAIDKMMRSIFF